MAEQIFIGVDGGGSGCRAVVGTIDRILGDATGGPANMTSDARGAVRSVLEVVMKAAAAAGLREVATARAHIGLAGVMPAAHSRIIQRAMPFDTCAITDDRPTTVAGALDGDGCVAAIGTGSFIAAKRGADMQFVGGWGLTLGDEASAAWLGRAALGCAVRHLDGMSQLSDLTNDILTQFDGDPNGIVAFAAKARPTDFGIYAPMVVAAADGDDPVALRLMQKGADYIEQALAVLSAERDLPLCLTGGLGPSYVRFLSPKTQSRIVPARGTALDGALALARDMT